MVFQEIPHSTEDSHSEIQSHWAGPLLTVTD